jgi:hypothetical protein
MDYSSEDEKRESTTPPFPPTPITPSEAEFVKIADANLKQQQEEPPHRFRNLITTESGSQTKTSDPRKFPSFKSYKPVKILSSNSNTDFPSLGGVAAAPAATAN